MSDWRTQEAIRRHARFEEDPGLHTVQPADFYDFAAMPTKELVDLVDNDWAHPKVREAAEQELEARHWDDEGDEEEEE